MQNNNESSRQEKDIRLSKPRKSDKKIRRGLFIRKTLKAAKPDFNRLESWRYKRVKSSWRKPRGIDNHMRLKKKGWPKSVDIGYRSPKTVRGFHPSGFEEVIVYNVKDLEKINSNQAIRIGHTVGDKKRANIIERANELKIFVLNKRVKTVETY